MPDLPTTRGVPSDRAITAGSLAVIGGLYAWFFVNAYRRIGTVKPGGLATGDFEHFYFGARAMLDGQDVYTSGHNGYIYPPLLAFLYTPFARLGLDAAALSLLVVNLVLGLLTAWIAGRTVVERVGANVGVPARFVCVVLVGTVATLLALDKLKGEYQMWQTNVLVMLMFAVALWQLDKRPWLAGLALGLAFNIKYLPVAALPYLLMRRRWKAAGWFAAGIAGFALLPAVLVGWATNLHYLKTAFAGFARLIGVDAGEGPKANIDGITAPYSVSVTSALARLFQGGDAGYGHGDSATVALAAAAGIGVAYAGALLWMYRRRGVPAILWPRESGQGTAMFRAMVAVEWVGLMVAVLSFGPQTNMRHMSLLLVVFAPAAAILLFAARGVSRVPLMVGTAVLFLAITLPPGGDRFDDAVRFWRQVGGPGVCMLVYFASLVWTGLAQARALGEETPGGQRAGAPGAAVR